MICNFKSHILNRKFEILKKAQGKVVTFSRITQDMEKCVKAEKIYSIRTTFNVQMISPRSKRYYLT